MLRLKYSLKPKELEVISRYFELIPVSLSQIPETNGKGTNMRAQPYPVPSA